MGVDGSQRIGAALTPRFGVASASGVNPALSLKHASAFSRALAEACAGSAERRNMSAVQLLRVSVHERLSAAAEDVLLQVEKGGEKARVPALRAKLTERLALAEYEDRMEQSERSEREIRRQRRLLDAVMQPEVRLHRAVYPAEVQQLMVNKEEDPSEQQQLSPLVDQEDPQPPHIKEEQEEPWTDQDGKQLQGLEEADIKFTLTPVAVKSEEDEEKLISSKLHPSETKENRADCGGPESAINSGPEDKFEDSSMTEDTVAPSPSVTSHGVTGAGAFFLLDHGAVSIVGAEGGPLEGTGYAVSGGHSGRVSGPSRGSPQLRRPLGEPSGWRLAAD
ncbi:unnamed protein product [Pleuronectes platessa]|uniref:Uncharacterized protein n=1 Tax=Pleuronectes platessa TaxID=8262 RepID=A0A9N7YNW6_PLEPL|nr:unnamed protein product [Pleuronectes platessa]